MRVKDAMIHKLNFVFCDTLLVEAAETMMSLEVGALAVLEGNAVVGIVTDRDIVTRGIASMPDPKTARVADVMTLGVVQCSEEDSIDRAASLMKDQLVHRLIVLDAERRPVGMLSVGDLAGAGVDADLIASVLREVSPARTTISA